MDVARLSAMARQFMTETVDVQRMMGRGPSAAPQPVVTGVAAWRLVPQGNYLGTPQGGFDAIQRLKFVLDTSTPLYVKDVVVDAAGTSYRVVNAQRTLPGLPLELEVEAMS